MSDKTTTAGTSWPEPMESLALAISDAHPALAWLYEHPMLCRGMARAAFGYLTTDERAKCGIVPPTDAQHDAPNSNCAP